MSKYYVMADLRRASEPEEGLPLVSGAEVYAGKIKAVIEAKDRDEALAVGRTLITGCLKKGITAYQWTYMPVLDAQKMGDTAIYEKYPTATWLTYYRIQAGLTQKRLADLAGINIRQVQKIENGETLAANTTAKNLLSLADALGIEPHKLL